MTNRKAIVFSIFDTIAFLLILYHFFQQNSILVIYTAEFYND